MPKFKIRRHERYKHITEYWVTADSPAAAVEMLLADEIEDYEKTEIDPYDPDDEVLGILEVEDEGGDKVPESAYAAVVAEYKPADPTAPDIPVALLDRHERDRLLGEVVHAFFGRVDARGVYLDPKRLPHAVEVKQLARRLREALFPDGGG